MRCLLVDDDPYFLWAAPIMLEREGIDVVAAAATCAEARRYSEDLRPDVVLVDIALRGESGLGLARQLTAGDTDGDPQVILMSNYSPDDLGDLMADSPAIPFLSKTDLSGAAIRAILTEAGASRDWRQAGTRQYLAASGSQATGRGPSGR